MIQVTSFLATLPPKQLAAATASGKISQKLDTLERFAQGVRAAGDRGSVSRELRYSSCDVAVMLGWVHEHGKQAPHLLFRQALLDQQRRCGGRTVIADSNLFLYHDLTNPHYYLRYSFDGVFPDTGEYCDHTPDPDRWNTIQRHMNIQMQPWRTTGDHILLCLQREGGWSMQGRSVLDWVSDTIMTLRNHTDRPIRVRTHPGDRKAQSYMSGFQPVDVLKRVTLSDPVTSLLDDLKNCWAVVNHNSSPAVGAALEGVPIFVTDPVRSQAREVANTDLSLIETPNRPDREAWVRRLSQFHWSHDDLVSGRCWQHMRQWVLGS
jgi:hypothetical protein